MKFILAFLLLVNSFSLPAKAQETKEHILAATDTLDVKVFQESDLDAKVTISKDGKVALPLIGQVSMVGLTTAEAANLIAQKYKDGYLVNPSVTVSVTDYAKRRFTILGAVSRPGGYFFPNGEEVTLLQAIGMAGGYSKIANPSKILVKRGEGGKTIKVDGKKVAGEGASSFQILPGDLITVGESIF